MQNFLGTLSQFYDNATGLFGMPDIDGGLIGGASLNADEFGAICRAAGNR